MSKSNGSAPAAKVVATKTVFVRYAHGAVEANFAEVGPVMIGDVKELSPLLARKLCENGEWEYVTREGEGWKRAAAPVATAGAEADEA